MTAQFAFLQQPTKSFIHYKWLHYLVGCAENVCRDVLQTEKVVDWLLLLHFFVVIAWHYQVPDGFDQHFQPSVKFPLTSSVNKSQQHQNKFLGMPRIEPEAAEWDAKILPLC